MSRFLFGFLFLAMVGCERASRYPAAPLSKTGKNVGEAKAVWGWITPLTPPRDIPIRFVASNEPGWDRWPTFWNAFPLPSLGPRTLHLGQSPLGIAAVFVLLENVDEIVIKVPRGLPNPTSGIPAANPPTFGQWKLGKSLFYDKVLRAGRDVFSCANCHQPDHGFTERNAISLETTRNTPSLLNVTYQRPMFWDGRVEQLEETLVRSLEDELETSRTKTLNGHRWGGLALRLNQNPAYREQFSRVFGVPRVTQDGLAKALATFLRTILSGDSFHDRAVALAGNESPKAAHYLQAMADVNDPRRRLLLEPFGEPLDPTVVAEKIERGHRLFTGKAGCVTCHSTSLFTDRQFYNTLIGDSGRSQAVSGQETGRFAVLPIGLKDPTLRGAYRTPTLRSLASTGPYFHDGSRQSLIDAVNYYGKHLDESHPLLAAPLRTILANTPPEFPGSHPLLLNAEETEAVVMFLHSLQGQPVDPMLLPR